MPLIWGIPIIAGLVGLFGGAMVDRSVDNATTPVSANKSNAWPWWVILILVVLGIVIGLKLMKKYIKI